MTIMCMTTNVMYIYCFPAATMFLSSLPDGGKLFMTNVAFSFLKCFHDKLLNNDICVTNCWIRHLWWTEIVFRRFELLLFKSVNCADPVQCLRNTKHQVLLLLNTINQESWSVHLCLIYFHFVMKFHLHLVSSPLCDIKYYCYWIQSIKLRNTSELPNAAKHSSFIHFVS